MKLRKARRRRSIVPQVGRGKYRHRETLADLSGKESFRRILNSSVQAKLKVAPANDKYEQEADRVADKVMSMPDASLQRVEGKDDEEQVQSKPLADRITPLVQRQADEEEEPVQAKADVVSTRTLSARSESVMNSTKSGGRPLDKENRAFFESRFGTNFGKVRVHDDGAAADAASSLQARAFTHGHHITFGAGEYAPAGAEGKRLLAHELTHTLQQKGHAKSDVQRALDPRHDLSSSLFFGDTALEAVYDKKRTLKSGSKGAAVKKLQRGLIRLGYSLPKYGADGVFGAETVSAVSRYQKAHASLSQDAVVGTQTVATLDKELFSGSTGQKKANVDVQEYSGGQKAAVENAIAVAFEMTERAQKKMGAGADALYKKWFDFHYNGLNKASAARFKRLRWRWIKLYSVFKSKDIEIEHMDAGEVPKGKTYDSLYAYIYPADGKYHLWLGGAFWNAPLRGRDSRGGTIVHELSHEESGTDDHKYGAAKAEALAKTDPDKAASNADNWEYFAENS